MKTLILLAALLAGCATTIAVGDVYRQAQKSVVLIQTDGGHGSGAAINDKCAVTAAHVISGALAITIQTGDETVHKAHVAVEDDAQDVAVVCSEDALGIPAAKIGQKPKEYESVFTIGFPLYETRMLTTGQYSEGSIISAQVAPGSSGGGVFDMDGKVVAVISSIAMFHTVDGVVLAFPHMVSVIDMDKFIPLMDAKHIEYQL